MQRTGLVIVGAAAGLWLVACAASEEPEAPRAAGTAGRPNVVLVMTDDQGLGDFGRAGNPVLETPRLDAFAAECPDVARFYVSPVCAPTRASLMTGRWNYRTRAIDTYIGRAMLEPEEVTLAEVLRCAGYRTGIFGKWHLGDAYPLRPQDQGFDVTLVHRGGGLAQPSEPLENERRYTDPILFEDGEPVQTRGYCTDVYFDRALEFIDECADAGRPFLAYVATNAPHGPFHDVPPELLAKYAGADYAEIVRDPGADPGRIARIYAMLEGVDRSFGRLLDHLDARGLADDTLVVFLCDNGPVPGRRVAGLRGSKTEVLEGGIRSPLWVRWPGRLQPGTRVAAIAAHVDLLPTLLEACGVAPPAGVRLDGRSLLPLLEGRATDWPERTLVLQAHRGDVPAPEHQFALLQQRWKLLRASGFGREAAPPEHPFELYDLAADPGESRDLAAQRPEVVARLRAEYAAWFADVSATRADNYAPPRIRPGSAREPRTWLTHQDWRQATPDGWGRNGTWLLELERDCELDVTLVLREPRALERVALHVDAGGPPRLLVELDPAQGPVTRVELGPVAFARGPCDLRIDCLEPGDSPDADASGPYQVLLERR